MHLSRKQQRVSEMHQATWRLIHRSPTAPLCHDHLSVCLLYNCWSTTVHRSTDDVSGLKSQLSTHHLHITVRNGITSTTDVWEFSCLKAADRFPYSYDISWLVWLLTAMDPKMTILGHFLVDWAGFNIPLNTLQVISGTSFLGVKVKWPNQQCKSTEANSSQKDEASIPPGPPHHVTILQHIISTKYTYTKHDLSTVKSAQSYKTQPTDKVWGLFMCVGWLVGWSLTSLFSTNCSCVCVHCTVHICCTQYWEQTW